MEIKEETPSVIARLMGLYESRHQRPIQKQYRVLSEDFLRKSASIGLLLKQSSCNRRAFRMNRVKMPEFKDVFEGQEQQRQYIQTISMERETSCAAKESIRFGKQNSKYEQCDELDERILDSLRFSDAPENIRSNRKISLKHSQKKDSLFPYHSHDQLCTLSPMGQSIVFKSYDDPCYRKDENCWKPEKTAARRNVLRSPQKLQYDSDTSEDLQNDLRNISKLRVKVKNKIPINDEARETGKPIINLEPCKDSFTTLRKTVEVCVSKFGAYDNSVNETKTIIPYRSSLSNLKTQEQASYPYSKWSTYTREGRNIDAGGLCSKHSQNSEKSELSRPLGVDSKYGMKTDVVTKSSRFKSFPLFFNATGNSNSKNRSHGFHSDEYPRHEESVTEAGNRFGNQEFSNKGTSKPEDSTSSCETSSSSVYMDLENNHSTEGSVLNELGSKLEDKNLSEEILKKAELSEVSHTSVGQELPIGSTEDDLIFSSCLEFEPELTSSWRDTHQSSPDSVLNPPYEDEILSDIECFEGSGPAGANLISLWKQLQLLKSDVEDALSEGPGMMVSSDEGTRDVSDDILKENGKSGVFRAKETRNFSYLVDVLDEAGLYDANWEIDIDKWHYPEFALNPSVFEALEKKYGDQNSWEIYERRLLFDRINSGLMEILQPCLDIPKWANSLSTWLGTQPKRDVTEERLWNLLVSQEKAVNKGLSEKAIGGDISWLKLGGDIDIIVRELENFLFDELVAELGIV